MKTHSSILRYLLIGQLFVSLGGAWAQAVDPTKALIGTWEGTVGVSGARTDRKLIINSVKAKAEGSWVARGRFGFSDIDSNEPGGFPMDVSIKDNDVFIEFVTPGGTKSPVRLKLVGNNILDGTINMVVRGGRAEDRQLKLEKVEPKGGDVK